jgi:hypothetical protein
MSLNLDLALDFMLLSVFLLADCELEEMLNQIYSSQPHVRSLQASDKFFSADVPPTWRSEVEAWASMRELPRPGVKLEERQDYHADIPEDDQEDDISDSMITGKFFICLTKEALSCTVPTRGFA